MRADAGVRRHTGQQIFSNPQKAARMKPGLIKTILVVLLLPLMGVTGCRSSASAQQDAVPVPSRTSTSTSTSSAAPQTTAPAPETGSPAEASEGTSADTAPSEAAQSPQPAPEPTFAAAEQKFLENRVPVGTDPNAVLQVGQERCDQLISARALDPEAVLSELIMNPAQETSDAVASLCPELQPDLDAASRGFPDGVFSIGEAAPHADNPSVAAGTYRAYGSPEGCELSLYAGSGDLIGSYDGTSPVTIGPDAARVESAQCYSWFRS